MSQIPGITAKHAIITPVCRKNRTDYGAFFEAIERLRTEYLECCKVAENESVNYHLVLSVEQPVRVQPGREETQ